MIRPKDDMGIYEFLQDGDRWDGVDLVNGSDMEKFAHWRGERRGEHWTPVKVALSPARLRKNRGRAVDFPGFTIGPPVLSQRALDALQHLIGKHVEVLPLACETQPFYVLNVLTVLDCFDEQRSEYETIGEGRLWVNKYVLKERAIHGEPIFRLTADRASLLISEDFRRIVEQHQLTGLLFEPVELIPVQ